MIHAGGFTCAQVDEGSQHLADAVCRLRAERNAALRAYDAEVIGRRAEVTRLHAELGKLRAESVLADRAAPRSARDWRCRDQHWMPEGWCSYCLASGVYNGNCREHCWPMAAALRLRNADAESAWESEGGR